MLICTEFNSLDMPSSLEIGVRAQEQAFYGVPGANKVKGFARGPNSIFLGVQGYN